MVERIGKSYDPLVGREVAKCMVEERIGKGGMGIVYRVRHRTLLKDLALKVLPIGSSLTQRQIEQFFVEARAQASVEHPNVVQVLDVDRFNNWFYILMQLVDGPSLREAIDAEQGLPWPLVARIGWGTSLGLHAAHCADPPLIHRDIKPNNVLIGPGWEAKVLDFGLVVQADGEAPKSAAGTTHYVPPELLVGRAPTAVSDLYSMGITLFEAVSNRRVFPGKTQQEVLKARLTERPPKLVDVVEGIPVEFSRLIYQLLAPKPEKRPPSAKEVAERFYDLWKSSGMTELPVVPSVDGEALPPGGKLLTERPDTAQLKEWARDGGKVLIVCSKCSAHFLRRGKPPAQVPCPACNSKLTTPDKRSLDALQPDSGKHTARHTSQRRASAKGAAKLTSIGLIDDQRDTSGEHPVPGNLLLDPVERLHLPPALFGRDHVVGRILEFGNGQVTCIRISGSAGLGKTRMLEELKFPFRTRALLTCGFEPPADGSKASPYHPFDQLARELVRGMKQRIASLLKPVAKLHGPWIVRLTGPIEDVEELAGMFPAEGKPERVLTAFEALLEAVLGTEGATILFDDIDELSDDVVDLWTTMINMVDRHQTLLVATHEHALRPALAGPLSTLTEESFALEPLKAASLTPMLTSIFGLSPYPKELADTINWLAENNPRRLIGNLRALVADRLLIDTGEDGWRWSERYLKRGEMALPADIESELVARAAPLPKLHKHVLGVLAQVEGGLTMKQLAEAGNYAASQLQMVLADLDKNKLLRRWNDSLTITSPQLRAAHLEAIPVVERPALHAKLAAILEPEGGPMACDAWLASRLAYHLTEGGAVSHALSYQLRAAQAFVDKGILERAAAAYEDAIEALASRGTKRVSLFGRGKPQGPSIAEVRADLGELYVRMGLPEKAHPQLETGLEEAKQDGGHPGLIQRFDRGLALAHARQANYDLAVRHFAKVEDTKLADARLLAEMAQLYLIRDDLQRADALLEQAESMVLAPEGQLTVALGRVRWHRRHGRWDEVIEIVNRSLTTIDEAELRGEFYTMFQTAAARALVHKGDLREAGQRLEAARRHQSGVESDLETKRGIAELMLAVRQRDAALKAANGLRRLADEHKRAHEGAWALLYLGDASADQPKKARKALSEAYKSFDRLDSSLGRARCAMSLAVCDMATKDYAAAASKLDKAEQHLIDSQVEWPRARMQFLRSRLAYVNGEVERSIELLDEAGRLAEQAGLKLLLKRISRVSDQLVAQG